MLVENLLEWKKNFTADTRREALAEGIDKGVVKGEAQMLTGQLEVKFGSPLPDTVLQRIREADAETLLGWARRFVTADRLEAVFTD